MNYRTLLPFSLAALLLAGCGGSEGPSSETSDAAAISGGASTGGGAAAVNDERLQSAAKEPEQWMTHGGTYKEQRFSQLDQINTENIGELGLAWFADLDTNRGQESTPLMVDGVIYVSEAWSKVSAFDARTGERLWFYDPMVPGERGAYGCCDVVNRGVAVWEGKVYVGAYDGRLIALDAQTGEEVWSEVTFDQSKFYSLTGAPRVAKGKVLIGNAGAEFNTRGYVSAYDAETGELEWRFYTVPGNPELGFENDAMRMAADTWTGEWWDMGGGGSTWDAITYDPETNLIYFGVGNGSPWNPLVRSPEGGDNLFTVSLVALDADTGDYVWHYQHIPAEEWDYDATQQITVADLEIDGQMRHVLIQAPKMGFIYLLDAYTGELLSADNFVDVNWAFGYDMNTGRPIVNEAASYTKREGAVIVQPGPQGAHSWHPMSFSPDTGLVYIPAQDTSIPLMNAPGSQFGNFRLGVDWRSGFDAYDDPENTIPRQSTSRLIAWDPVKSKEVWNVNRLGGRPSGVLSSAGGLVFQGNGADEEFVAYRADNGERLWSFDVQTGVSAGPISYQLDGVQYVAQVVGGSQRGGYYAPSYARLLVFKLGGVAQLPEKIEFTQRPINPPAVDVSEASVAAGEEIYGSACSMCHGDGGASRGMFPDLRRTPLLHTQEGFDAVVLDGILSGRGMISFAGQLSKEDTANLRNFIIFQAQALNASAIEAPR